MSETTILRDDERRLNLEQQKIRAKELRRAVARGEPEAIARLQRHHPEARGLPAEEVPQRCARLSDAQLVIARELGLPSWPKLKAHIEGLARARRAIAAKAAAPDGERRTLHIRCGHDIRDRLKEAGFVGDFLVTADPYWLGPLPHGEDFIPTRAQLIAERCGLAAEEVQAQLAQSYAALAEAGERYARIVLWFEHDIYDQLALARVLAEFAGRTQRPTLDLVCVDRFPPITRFIGLGQLSPAALRLLWEGRRHVDGALLRLGAAVWRAVQEPAPSALHALAAGGTPELPVMASALTRHLQELPWLGDGLSLSERLALQALRDGPQTISQLFKQTQHGSEPLPFMGDLFFWAVLRDMLRAAQPPFAIDPATAAQRWPQQRLALTTVGERLLAGELDWMTLNPLERWVGGVRIAPGAPRWRWSEAERRPVET